MQRSEEIRLIRRLLEHRAKGTTDLAPHALRLSASRYTSDERLAREQRVLFRDGPIVAGLSADLPEPGSWMCSDTTGVPLLLTRDRGGRARAFVNGCRHRGSRVAEGRGVAAGGTLRCPFHAWTYDVDGRLRAIPEARDAFEQLDPADLGLHERPCAEAHGLLLVRGAGDASIDAEVALRGVAADLDALDPASFRHVDSRTTRWRCNWKLALDTFLESYHVFSLHRETVHPWYPSHPMVCDRLGDHLRFPVARHSLSELAGRPEEEWRLADHATVQWWIAPAALLSWTRDVLLLWRFWSPRPDRCVAHTSFYARGAAAAKDADALAADFDLQLRVTGSEDFPNQERIQQVLDAGGVPELVLGRNEVGVIGLHAVLDERLERDAG